MFNIQESARFTITKASPASGIYENLPTLKCCPELISCAIELSVRFQYIYIFQLFFLGTCILVIFNDISSKNRVYRKYQRKKVEKQIMLCFILHTECPAKLFPLGYLLFCRLLLMQIAKVGTFLKNSRNLLQDRHKNFEN